jgi:hypothetical protein
MTKCLSSIPVLLGACAFLLAGCDSADEGVLSARSSVKAQLPAKPALTQPQYKRVHGDGVLTVEGLLRERDAHLKSRVKVRGKVEAVTLCDKVVEESPMELEGKSKKKQRGKVVALVVPAEPIVSWNCNPQPFALLVDAEGSSRHKLRVGGTMGSRLADLKVGQLVDLEGDFSLVSPNRKYVDQQGVLFLTDVKPLGSVVSP